VSRGEPHCPISGCPVLSFQPQCEFGTQSTPFQLPSQIWIEGEGVPLANARFSSRPLYCGLEAVEREQARGGALLASTWRRGACENGCPGQCSVRSVRPPVSAAADCTWWGVAYRIPHFSHCGACNRYGTATDKLVEFADLAALVRRRLTACAAHRRRPSISTKFT